MTSSDIAATSAPTAVPTRAPASTAAVTTGLADHSVVMVGVGSATCSGVCTSRVDAISAVTTATSATASHTRRLSATLNAHTVTTVHTPIRPTKTQLSPGRA